jgi:aminoglycoside phosphotransferase (APT) family kinase protein
MTPAPDRLLQSALDALGMQSAVLVSAENRATDSIVWKVRHRGRLLAIRILREEQRPVMELERHAIELALRHELPAPEIVGIALIDGIRPAMAIEWIDGETVGDVLLRQPRLARRLGASTGALLARLHEIRDRELPNAPDWIIRGAHGDPHLTSRLNELASQSPTLIHLDVHPFNLMARGGMITGLLDWTNCTVGDPRADIARTLSIMQISAPAFIAEFGAQRMTMGIFTRALLRSYVQLRGPLHDLAPFLAWAGQCMRSDIGPKLLELPVSSPERLMRRIETRSAVWRQAALSE